MGLELQLAERGNHRSFVGGHYEVLLIHADAEFDLPGDPRAARLGRGCRIVDADVVHHDTAGNPLVVPAHVGSARGTLHDDGDAVELFVARVKDVACHDLES